MNAIISICHFCELHGPSVVFSTQAFRDLLDLDALTDARASEVLPPKYFEDGEQGGEESLWKYGRLHEKTNSQLKNVASVDTCVACRSFPHNQPGFISNDDSARVSYISSQYPLQSELYILVRQACIRSLSCEVCPEREGPIYFGDEARGHVLSHTFFLRDVQARGFQRWYSILVLMKDKMLLLNSWPFIVRHLRQHIGHLQESASKIYEGEESKVSHRALRSAASMMDNFRRQRVAGQPRSLSELVGEQDVWQHLHSAFTWMLKAGGLRLQERLVEGPPVHVYVPDGSAVDNGINVRLLYDILGGSVFHRLMHHLLTGRQVIMRGSSANVIPIIVQSLQPLLPKHCYRAINFSTHYVDSASCNILGLDSLAKIPQVIIASGNLCLIDVISHEEHHETHVQECKSNMKRTSSVVGAIACEDEETEKTKNHHKESDLSDAHISEIKKCTFKIAKEGSLPARPPQILNRIESAVGSSTLALPTLMLYLSSVIYEWINKVKVWIHVHNLKQMCNNPLERTLSPVTNSHPIVLSSAIPILRSPTNPLSRSPVMSTIRSASPGGVSSTEATPQDERHQLLAALGSTEWDVPLLEFWAKNFVQNHGQEVY